MGEGKKKKARGKQQDRRQRTARKLFGNSHRNVLREHLLLFSPPPSFLFHSLSPSFSLSTYFPPFLLSPPVPPFLSSSSTDPSSAIWAWWTRLSQTAWKLAGTSNLTFGRASSKFAQDWRRISWARTATFSITWWCWWKPTQKTLRGEWSDAYCLKSCERETFSQL